MDLEKQLKAIEAKGSMKSPTPSYNFDKKSNGSTSKIF